MELLFWHTLYRQIRVDDFKYNIFNVYITIYKIHLFILFIYSYK